MPTKQRQPTKLKQLPKQQEKRKVNKPKLSPTKPRKLPVKLMLRKANTAKKAKKLLTQLRKATKLFTKVNKLTKATQVKATKARANSTKANRPKPKVNTTKAKKVNTTKAKKVNTTKAKKVNTTKAKKASTTKAKANTTRAKVNTTKAKVNTTKANTKKRHVPKKRNTRRSATKASREKRVVGDVVASAVIRNATNIACQNTAPRNTVEMFAFDIPNAMLAINATMPLAVNYAKSVFWLLGAASRSATQRISHANENAVALSKSHLFTKLHLLTKLYQHPKLTRKKNQL
jgi:hypothetical protein